VISECLLIEDLMMVLVGAGRGEGQPDVEVVV
jgi:hypothetical protein